MSTETDTEPRTETAPEVAFGLEENVAAALAYIPILGLVFLLVEKDNAFVRFHSAQSVVLAVAFLVLAFVVGFVSIVLAFLPVIDFLAGVVFNLFYLAVFVAWLFLVYQAFSNERYEVPVVAGVAETLEDAL